MLQASLDWKARLKAQVLSDRIRQRAAMVRQLEQRPTCRTLIALVAEFYDLRPSEVLGPRRFKRLVKARRMACVVCQMVLKASTSQIGRALNRDHSTIVHHLAQAKKPDFDEQTCASIVEKINRIRGALPVDAVNKIANESSKAHEFVHYGS